MPAPDLCLRDNTPAQPLPDWPRSIRNRAIPALATIEARMTEALANSDDLIVRLGDEFEFSTDQIFLHLINAGTSVSAQIETGNIVGYIRSREHGFAIQVSSRFGDAFLCHMISSTEGFLALEDLGPGTDQGFSEWLLIYVWKVRLRQAFAAGIPKMYVQRSRQTATLRGSLDLNLCSGVPSPTGRYPCRYREHAFDNPITRLIHTTFNVVSKRDKASEMIGDAHRIRQAFAEANGDLRLLRPNEYRTRALRNPYFEAYNGVADLSRKILAQQTADLGLEDEDFSGFLFDISLLFEHYVRTLLRNTGLALEPKMSPATSVKYPVGERRRKSLIPDIILSGPNGTLILDVKYKRWHEEVSREDSFQLISYVAAYRQRYEQWRRPIFGYGFVFPTAEEPRRPYIEEFFSELGLRFFVFFLRVPQVNDLAGSTGDFHEQILQGEKTLTEHIAATLGRH